MERNKDVYVSLKQELMQAQSHLGALRTSLLKARGRRRTRRQREIARQVIFVRKARARLASAQPTVNVTPLAGLEWFLALTLWFFNATCWTAWFGQGDRESDITDSKDILQLVSTPPDHHVHDSVRGWLVSYQQRKPEHCALLFERYRAWCERHDHELLPERNFYTRLGELGTRKFRDGRNGPTLYQLPHDLLAQSGEEAE